MSDRGPQEAPISGTDAGPRKTRDSHAVAGMQQDCPAVHFTFFLTTRKVRHAHHRQHRVSQKALFLTSCHTVSEAEKHSDNTKRSLLGTVFPLFAHRRSGSCARKITVVRTKTFFFAERKYVLCGQKLPDLRKNATYIQKNAVNFNSRQFFSFLFIQQEYEEPSEKLSLCQRTALINDILFIPEYPCRYISYEESLLVRTKAFSLRQIYGFSAEKPTKTVKNFIRRLFFCIGL